MANIGKFDGNLIHPVVYSLEFPTANVTAAATPISDTREFSIYDASCLLSCMNALPVLKGFRCFYHSKGAADWNLGDGERLFMEYKIWNISEDGVPDIEELRDGSPHYECLGGGTFEIKDANSGATMVPVWINPNPEKNYGIDGIVLRPTNTLQTIIDNNTSTTIANDSQIIDVEYVIDWVQVSESEFDDYLKELWLFQAIGDLD